MLKHKLTLLFVTALIVVSSAFGIPADYNQDVVPYIVNGSNSTRGQFPYYAFFRFYECDNCAPSYCGGNIISDQWILTAAHCVDTAKRVEVILGVLTLNDYNEAGRITMGSTEIIVHPYWNRNILHNDIALIRLPRKIQFSRTIQPVKLPSACDTFQNQWAVATGFGQTNTTEAGSPPVLQWTYLYTISNAACSRHFSSIYNRRSVICTAGYQNKSICFGDSGGPLVHSTTNTLIGLASFVMRAGCHYGYPQAFTFVPEYLQWIHLRTGIPITKC